jgi:hypothetical protein
MGHSHSSRAEETNTGEGTAAESIEVTEVGTAQVQADLHQSGATGAANTDGIQWFWGIKEDLLVRLPLVKSDWDLSDANLLKLFSATMFAYFTSILPAIIFGDQLNKSTDGQFGVPETIAATGAMGLLYSLFAGQGLVIIGVTGPVVFYVNTIVSLCNAINAPFMQMMLWACFWCGLMHVIVAASGATILVKRVTSFSGECFGFFIATAYIYLGTKGIVQTFWQVRDDDDDDDDDDDTTNSPAGRRGAAFACLTLALLTYKLAISFHHARSWKIFKEYGRDVVAQFGMVTAIFACTVLSYAPVFDDGYVRVARLEVSGSFGKNIPTPLMGGDMKIWQVFFAIIPATMLLVLFFFDHNVSSLLSQQKRFKLVKPPSYHYDFAVLGIIFALCGFFGVPPGNGLIPQAPLHVRALATIENINGKEVYRKVEEKRWSNFLQSVLCLVTLLIMPVISMIPHAVLNGTFLYMGVTGLGDNGLFDRACGMFMDSTRRPALWDEGTKQPDWVQQVRRYTLTQLACVTVIFVISLNCFLGLNGPPISITFPFFIAALVPIREKLLPTFLTAEELEILDPFDPTDEPEQGGEGGVGLRSASDLPS